jgi:hypothetical protein
MNMFSHLSPMPRQVLSSCSLVKVSESYWPFDRCALCIIRGMETWEYCAVSLVTYREGSGETHELLTITFPGAHPESIKNPFGLIGLLNQLGADGWELVDVEAGVFYLKRQAKPLKSY